MKARCMVAKILIADDHDLFRVAIKGVIANLEDAYEVLDARTTDEVGAIVARESDIVLLLLDLMMGGNNTLDMIKPLREQYPEMKITIISGFEDQRAIQKAFERGAVGYLLKADPAEVTERAIGLILAGGTFVPSTALGAGLNAMRSDAESTDSGRLQALTPRQTEILKLLGEGMSNAQIAHAMGISEGTARVHVSAILKALKVPSRTRAALIARELLAD